MTSALTLGYRDAIAVADSPLAAAGTRAHGHEFHRTAIRGPAAGTPAGEAPVRAANAWRWQARDAVVTEGLIRGGVHASYLHTHWNGIPGAADRMVAAARAHRAARAHD
jgi:cobyrinic acid a,c-diamide synthase